MIILKKYDKKITKRLFFLHLPKTAGTTFANSLYTYFGPTGYIREILNSPDETLKEFSKKLSSKKLDQINCVIGHFHFGLHTFFSGDYEYVTFFRNPVKRVLSLYYHIRDRREHPLHKTFHKQKISTEDFFRGFLTKEAVNDQTRRIASAYNVENISHEHFNKAIENINNHFSCIGLTERYDDSMIVFEKIFYQLSDLSYPSALNEQRTILSDKVDRNTYQIIEEYNHYDIKLYKYAEEVFKKQIDSYSGYFPKARTNFKDRCKQKALTEDQWQKFIWLKKRLTNKINAEIRKYYFK